MVVRRVILGVALAGLAGCRDVQQPRPAPHDPGTAAGATGAATHTRYPFAPAALRVHPLTHVDDGLPEAKGSAPKPSELVLHFELLDRFGDSVKGLGTLSVELYKPGAGMTPGIETQELTWDVPGMDDAEQNTRRFDGRFHPHLPRALSVPHWVVDAVSPLAHCRGGSRSASC